ncbi:MAG: DUF6273 domain-containing protein [Ruminococcus flavefaciens]|nr:DUF6273 domain-containing protein [Ruminococcus flavefaciens]
MYINVNGVKRNVASAWCNNNGIPIKIFSKSNSNYNYSTITWSDGTDEEICAMLDAHYAGLINIYDYWNVGDKRKITLKAMKAYDVDESHREQTVTMVLMHKGGKTLTTSINGKTECAFIVGQQDSLLEYGYMSKFIDEYGWNTCNRRIWCNGIYREAFPDVIRTIFKQHKNITVNNKAGSLVTSNDYFALPSEKEVFGEIKKANTKEGEYHIQFDWFKTNKIANSMTRSLLDGTYDYFIKVFQNSNGKIYPYSVKKNDKYLYFAPFSVI